MTSTVATTAESASGVRTQRGTTTIARRVFEKVAAQIASEVSAAGGTSGGFLGIGAKHDLDARPKVDITLHGNDAVVAVRCGVRYPASLRDTTEEVRSHVIDRLQVLTGVSVRRVDIEVGWLARPESVGPQLT